MKETYLGAFDLGGTKVTVLVSDLSGRIIERSRESTSTRGGKFVRWKDGTAYYGISQQMVEMLRRAMASAGVSVLSGIGIGSAGPIQGGTIRNSSNIKLQGVPKDFPDNPLYIPLVEPLAESFAVPVCLDNDCSAGVLGELYYGAGKETLDKSRFHLVYVTLSTGFGGGIWDGGHLVRGKEGNTEVGHFVVHKGGLKCGCGNYGCVEAYCSGSGIAKNARIQLVNEGLPMNEPLMRLAKAAVSSKGSSSFSGTQWELLEFIDAPLVFEAALSGDGIARRVLQEACCHGGIALANIANAYDPDVISFGGSIAINHPEFVEEMRIEMEQHLNVGSPEIQITPLGDRAVEYGAMVLARQASANSSIDAKC